MLYRELTRLELADVITNNYIFSQLMKDGYTYNVTEELIKSYSRKLYNSYFNKLKNKTKSELIKILKEQKRQRLQAKKNQPKKEIESQNLDTLLEDVERIFNPTSQLKLF